MFKQWAAGAPVIGAAAVSSARPKWPRSEGLSDSGALQLFFCFCGIGFSLWPFVLLCCSATPAILSPVLFQAIGTAVVRHHATSLVAAVRLRSSFGRARISRARLFLSPRTL